MSEELEQRLRENADPRCNQTLPRLYLEAADTLKRYREALERIGWHELTWQEARGISRQTLNPKGGDAL